VEKEGLRMNVGVPREPGSGRSSSGFCVLGLYVGAAPLRWIHTYSFVDDPSLSLRLLAATTESDPAEGGAGGHCTRSTLLCQMSTTFLCYSVFLAFGTAATSTLNSPVELPSSQDSLPGSRHARKRKAMRSRLAFAH
jgi:hypothetical protein